MDDTDHRGSTRSNTSPRSPTYQCSPATVPRPLHPGRTACSSQSSSCTLRPQSGVSWEFQAACTKSITSACSQYSEDRPIPARAVPKSANPPGVVPTSEPSPGDGSQALLASSSHPAPTGPHSIPAHFASTPRRASTPARTATVGLRTSWASPPLHYGTIVYPGHPAPKQH